MNNKHSRHHIAYSCGLLAFLPSCLLAFLSGCTKRSPGETFRAGYIFADTQSKVTRNFEVRNTTSVPIKVKDIDKSCTCTSFELQKYELAPGESTTLTMSVNVTRAYENRFATCVLNTDHPEFQKWNYRMEFTSLPFAVADPPDLNLGSFAVDGKNLDRVQQVALDLFAEATVDLGRENFTVPDEIEVTLQRSDRGSHILQPGVWKTRYLLTVRLSPRGREAVLLNSASGLVTKTIHLDTGNPISARWRYAVYWNALAPLEMRPAYLSFGNVLGKADGVEKTVVLTSTTGERFRVTSVSGECPGLRIASTVDSTEEAALHSVRFRAQLDDQPDNRRRTDSRSFFSGKIVLRTTHKLKPDVSIPVSAMYERSIRSEERSP